MRSELASLELSNAPLDRADQAAASHALRERFRATRAQAEALTARLSPEEAQVSSTGDTSPPKWHLAHTSWFFEYMALKAFRPGYRAVDESYDYLFNSYYETVGAYLPKKKRPQVARPSLSEVRSYRELVTERVLAFLGEGACPRAQAVIELGINHEEQHQELLLMDIKQNFYAHPLRPAYAPAPCRAPESAELGPPALRYLEFAGGKHSIGHRGESFAYDNEGGAHHVWLEPYALGSRLVTCGEYLEFVESGAYADTRLWLADGWDFLRAQKITAPLYWEKRDGSWFQFALSGERPLDPAEPVSHLSYYEAAAYAQWRGARLPTEFEWEAAAGAPEGKAQFLESGAWYPAHAEAETSSLAQAHGGLWEWTGSAYLPYPRYRPYDASLAEYNGKFMCNQMVLRGGSFATPRAHYRPTYRNFYYPQMRWHFSGLRLARSL